MISQNPNKVAKSMQNHFDSDFKFEPSPSLLKKIHIIPTNERLTEELGQINRILSVSKSIILFDGLQIRYTSLWLSRPCAHPYYLYSIGYT